MSGYRGTRSTPVAVIKTSNASSPPVVATHHCRRGSCADVTISAEPDVRADAARL